MLAHTLVGDGVRLAPWAHGSGREAFQPGRGYAHRPALKRSRAWRSCAVARRWILWRSALVSVAAVDA